MTYRASLGTRGELRRIAAEAESVTIDHVRPWIRKVQPCRLAPHVIIPRWIRLENPVKPKPPPPLVSHSRIASSELVEEILESATAKKFRRGRGRRGRPRKRTESAANPELKPADEDVTSGQVASEPLSGAGEVPEIESKATKEAETGNYMAKAADAGNDMAKEAEVGNETTREAEISTVLLASDENMMDTEKVEVSVPAENHPPSVDEAAGNEIAKESEDGNETEKEAEMSAVLPASDENAMDTEEANVFVPGENLQPNVDEGARNEIGKESEDGNETEKEAGTGNEVERGVGTGSVTEKETGARNEMEKEAGTGNEMEKEAGTGNEIEKEAGTGNEMEQEAGIGNEMEKEVGTGSEMEKEVGTGSEMEKEVGAGNEMEKEVGTGNEMEQEAVTGNEMEQEAGTGGEIAKEAGAGDEIAREAGARNEAEKEAEMSAVLPASDENAMDTEKANVSVPEEHHQPNVDESNDEAVEKEQQDNNDASNEDIRSTAEPQLKKPDSLIPKESPLVPGQDVGDPAVPNTPKDATEEPKNSEDVEMTELAPEPTEMSS